MVKNLIGLLISLLVLIIVVYPLITSTITDLNLTGTDATIGGIFGTFLLLAGLVLIVSIFGVGL